LSYNSLLYNTSWMDEIWDCAVSEDVPIDVGEAMLSAGGLEWREQCLALGRLAVILFRIGKRDVAGLMALLGLSQDNPRGCYEIGMEFFYEEDFIASVRWSEMCLHSVPDWDYAFLAMHSLAAAYHKAGLLKMADVWARKAVEKAPFFEPSRTFLLPAGVVV